MKLFGNLLKQMVNTTPNINQKMGILQNERINVMIMYTNDGKCLKI